MCERYLPTNLDFHREPQLEAWLTCLAAAQASAQLAHGQWFEAAASAALILDASPVAPAGPRVEALTVLALVRARRADPGSWPLLDEARARAWADGRRELIARVVVARAEAAWLEARTDAIELETADMYRWALRTRCVWVAAELMTWRLRAGLAVEVPTWACQLHRLQAAGKWQQTALAWQVRGFPYEASLALAESSEPQPLLSALTTLRALGASAAAAIVTERMRELKHGNLPRGPRARTLANPHGLTPRQLEVLCLVAAGLHNSDIAERLVVSQKTIDHHVSAVLAKLGVRNRVDAATHATRLGLASSEMLAA